VAKAEQRSPFAPAHYRAFDATTGCSPPPRFGTLALAARYPSLLTALPDGKSSKHTPFDTAAVSRTGH